MISNSHSRQEDQIAFCRMLREGVLITAYIRNPPFVLVIKLTKSYPYWGRGRRTILTIN